MLDLTNLTQNQDILLAGGGYLLLKSFGVIDLVKSRITGSNGNNKSLKQFVSSEADAKESSRVMIQDIHARSESSAIELGRQTEILRSIDTTMQNVLRAIMDRRV